MGLTSTVLAKPYAALRTATTFGCCYPTTASGGSRLFLQAEHALRLAPYFNIWCLDLKLCALSFSFTNKGNLALGIPMLLHIQPSRGYMHPKQASLASTPNPLQELQGLPNLPLFSSWLELFSFPAIGGCQKPQLSRHLRLSKPNQCHY